MPWGERPHALHASLKAFSKCDGAEHGAEARWLPLIMPPSHAESADDSPRTCSRTWPMLRAWRRGSMMAASMAPRLDDGRGMNQIKFAHIWKLRQNLRDGNQNEAGGEHTCALGSAREPETPRGGEPTEQSAA